MNRIQPITGRPPRPATSPQATFLKGVMKQAPIVLLTALLAAGTSWSDRRASCRVAPRRLALRDAPAHAIQVLPGAGASLTRRVLLIRGLLPLDRPETLRWVPGIDGNRLHSWWPWLLTDGG